MAKKKDKELEDDFEKEDGRGNSIVTILIAIVVIIICLAIFSVLVKLDLGGFGSGVLQPILKDVPIVNSILPDQSDAELALENDYPYNNLSDAIQRIKELETALATSDTSSQASTTKVAELEAEIARLKVFENNQLDYEKRLAEFDQEVVFADAAPSVEEYQKYYEALNPDNAAEIYRQVIEQQQYDQNTIDQAERYAKMDPKAAAATLGIMTGDLDLVADILSSMTTKQSAAIMQEMDSNMLAKITKKMSLME